MEINETGKSIEELIDRLTEYLYCEEYSEECEQLIGRLNELQEYRQIGTIDECRDAREKQVAKVPDYEGDGYYEGELVYDTWICPKCGQHYQ